MDSLVNSLSVGNHKIEFESRIEKMEEVKERLENGFVFVTFVDTRGGTELGINVDKSLTNLKEADFKKSKGIIKVTGTCELNYHKIKCVAEVDLATKSGQGHLEPLDEDGNSIPI